MMLLASMRPQRFAADDAAEELSAIGDGVASMRPQRFAADDMGDLLMFTKQQ